MGGILSTFRERTTPEIIHSHTKTDSDIFEFNSITIFEFASGKLHRSVAPQANCTDLEPLRQTAPICSPSGKLHQSGAPQANCTNLEPLRQTAPFWSPYGKLLPSGAPHANCTHLEPLRQTAPIWSPSGKLHPS